MQYRLVIAIVFAAAAQPARADNPFEDLLIEKFKAQNQTDVNQFRAVVADAAIQAAKLKDTDPDRGIEILRDVRSRMDKLKHFSPAERRSFNEILQPLVLELRDASLLKRRELASSNLNSFRDFLVVGGYEGRFPGRSGAEGWEPANFISPNGQSRLGKLVAVSRDRISFKFIGKETHLAPPLFPLIQVFGGFYVFDKSLNHHVFMTNREFYNSVWQPLLKKYVEADNPSRPRLTPAEALMSPEPKLLESTVASGVYFLRGLPNLEPIPGVGNYETPFLESVLLALASKGMPIDLNRIYSRELQERLFGLSEIQWSATHRAVHLMQSRDISVSPLFAEILREETDKLVRSEYGNFTQTESNRAIFYIFSKLK